MENLPRLLYIGDVAVESSYHGSILLYRLLQTYPAAKLQIVEGDLHPSRADRRLSGVTYKSLPVGYERILRTRFHRFYSAFLSWTARYRARRIDSLIGTFEPEAVLTVTHGYSWITAARFASQRKLPLHLICHDDWPRLASPLFAKRWLDNIFGRIYRQAASRLCVSPEMQGAYRARYGGNGVVLYPLRGSDGPSAKHPVDPMEKGGGSFTVAFAGTINSKGYARALIMLGEVLAEKGGRLLLFGPLSDSDAPQLGLNKKNIELRGLLPSSKLIEQLRVEANALFVPISFDESDRAKSEVSFPSKLADYTAVGLPLIILGPLCCSAVRWADQNPGVAEVVRSFSKIDLSEAIERLMNSRSYARALANKAIAVGNKYFSDEEGQRIFLGALGPA